MNTYTLEKTITSYGAVVRIYRPDISDKERADRMKQLHKAAENLLKKV